MIAVRPIDKKQTNCMKEMLAEETSCKVEILAEENSRFHVNNFIETIDKSETMASTDTQASNVEGNRSPLNHYNSAKRTFCEVFEMNTIIKQGWLQKKGSGKDWMLNRNWKPRFASLQLTKLPNDPIPVPILHLYWHETLSTYPSTTIRLESVKIVKGMKRSDEQNSYIFDVVQAGSNELRSDTSNDDRSFAAPLKECNEWIRVLNAAVQQYQCRRTKMGFATESDAGCDKDNSPHYYVSIFRCVA